MVASNGGSDKSPAWLLNLEANSQVTIRVGRRLLAAAGREAVTVEQEELWSIVKRTNQGMAPLIHFGAT